MLNLKVPLKIKRENFFFTALLCLWRKGLKCMDTQLIIVNVCNCMQEPITPCYSDNVLKSCATVMPCGMFYVLQAYELIPESYFCISFTPSIYLTETGLGTIPGQVTHVA